MLLCMDSVCCIHILTDCERRLAPSMIYITLVIFNPTHIMNRPAVMTILTYCFIPEFAYMYMSLHSKLGWWVSKLIFVRAHFQYDKLQDLTLSNGHLNIVHLVKGVCHWQILQEARILYNGQCTLLPKQSARNAY